MRSTTYQCDGCDKEKRGRLLDAISITNGHDTIPEDWSDLRLQDFGQPLRAYFRHYCPGCTKRMLVILNSPLPQP